jgi:hypothetical protein
MWGVIEVELLSVRLLTFLDQYMSFAPNMHLDVCPLRLLPFKQLLEINENDFYENV